jgi:hypothetical protein
MNAAFKMPCKFSISITATHPIAFDNPDDPNELGHPDLSRMQYRATIVADDDTDNLRHKAILSPAFDVESEERLRPWECMLEMLQFMIADALVPEINKPRFHMEDGVMKIKA